MNTIMLLWMNFRWWIKNHLATPVAHAMGDRFWSNCACWGGEPCKARWYGFPGWGCYWDSIWGMHGVSGAIYTHLMFAGAECGFGLPITDQTGPYDYDLGWGLLRGCYTQYFYMPGTCDLKYIIKGPDQSTYAYVLPHYFC